MDINKLKKHLEKIGWEYIYGTEDLMQFKAHNISNLTLEVNFDSRWNDVEELRLYDSKKRKRLVDYYKVYTQGSTGLKKVINTWSKGIKPNIISKKSLEDFAKAMKDINKQLREKNKNTKR